MEIFGQTAFLVSDGTGSLVYHLVLLFALGTAAAMAVGRWSQARRPAAARLATGASVLLLLRLAGLVVALLAALLTTLNPLVLVPPFDRAASTLTLLVIIWIIAFPEPNRLADAAAGLFSVLVALGLVISWGLWGQEALATRFYNGSVQETVWEALQIGLLVGGLGLLALRRQRDWVLGLVALLVLVAGHIIHYSLPIGDSSIPGAERLAEIVAVPLIVALIYRRAHADAPAAAPAPPAPTLFAEPPVSAEDTGPIAALDKTLTGIDRTLLAVPTPAAPAAVIDTQAVLALTALSSAADQREFGEKLVVAAAHALQAPLSLLLTDGGPEGGLTVAHAYRLAEQRLLPVSFRVAVGEDDLLADLARTEAVTWQPGPSEEPLHSLARGAGAPSASWMLLAPIRPADGTHLGALAVLPPGEAAAWAGQALPLLQSLAQAAAAAWTVASQRAHSAHGLSQTQNQLAAAQQDLDRSRELAEGLANQLQLQRRAETVQTTQLQELEAERLHLQAAQTELEQRQQQALQLQAELDMTRAALALSSQEAAIAMAAAAASATNRDTHQVEIGDQRARFEALLNDYDDQQALAKRLGADLDQANQAAAEARAMLAAQQQDTQTLRASLEAQQQVTDSLRATLEDMQGDHELRSTLTERLSADLEQARAALAITTAADPDGQPLSLAALADSLAVAESRLAQQSTELLALRQALADSERQRAAAVVAVANTLPSPMAQPLQTADMEVIASVTQELRQPMSSIVGYADLLLSESVGIIGALQRKFLERIKASSERIGVLLDDLMRVMDIDSGNLRLAHESVDIMRVLEDALHGSEMLFQSKNLAVNCVVPPNLPPIQADRDALLQIFTHLLNNSGAASSSDSEVKLTLKNETDRRSGGEEVKYLVVSITDTGGGITPEDQPRVFSRLYRADAPLIAGLGDNGMGLSIAKALVEGHGGRIWVISEAGLGSTFYVLLPLEGRHSKVNGALQR